MTGEINPCFDLLAHATRFRGFGSPSGGGDRNRGRPGRRFAAPGPAAPNGSAVHSAGGEAVADQLVVEPGKGAIVAAEKPARGRDRLDPRGPRARATGAVEGRG